MLREVVASARRLLSIPAEPQWGSMPDRRWDTTAWLANNGKIGRELGWQPRFTLEHGLEMTAAWLAGTPRIYERYRLGNWGKP